MFDVINSVKKLLNKSESPSGEIALRFVKTRKEITRAIINSLDNQEVLGIYSPALGEGLFLTGVLFFETSQAEPIVTLNRYDHNGVLLHRTELGISEIKAACALKMKYENPLLKRTVQA
jgi:hypothetical protein